MKYTNILSLIFFGIRDDRLSSLSLFIGFGIAIRRFAFVESNRSAWGCNSFRIGGGGENPRKGGSSSDSIRRLFAPRLDSNSTAFRSAILRRRSSRLASLICPLWAEIRWLPSEIWKILTESLIIKIASNHLMLFLQCYLLNTPTKTLGTIGSKHLGAFSSYSANASNKVFDMTSSVSPENRTSTQHHGGPYFPWTKIDFHSRKIGCV